MKQTSLDGRSRKSPSSAKSSATAAVTATPKAKKHTEHNLKPASPPKNSPWGQITSVSSKGSDEFPALPRTKTATKGAKQRRGADDQEDIADDEIKADSPFGDRDIQNNNTASQIHQRSFSEDIRTTSSGQFQDFVPKYSQDLTHNDGEGEQKREKDGIVNQEIPSARQGLKSPKSPGAVSATIAEERDSLSQKDHVSDTISTCSTESRKLFEAAASRSSENIWTYGVGADVHVYAESIVYKVHRNVLVQHSGWFRYHLPPPNEDGTHVEIYLPFAMGAVGPCLSFMYTHRIDICERVERALNTIHLPRCVLGYCAAVTLQMSTLSSHLLRIVEATAVELADYFASHIQGNSSSLTMMDQKHGQAFVHHLMTALNIIHNEPCYELVRPMRLALAGVLDGVLPCLCRQEAFIYMLALPSWQLHSSSISADMVEHRRLAGYLSHSTMTGVVPSSEDEMEALFEKLTIRRGGNEGLFLRHQVVELEDTEEDKPDIDATTMT